MSKFRKARRKNFRFYLKEFKKFKPSDFVELKWPGIEAESKKTLQLRAGGQPQPRPMEKIVLDQGADKGIEMRSGNFTLQQQPNVPVPGGGIRVESPPPSTVVKTGGEEPEIIRISPLDLEAMYVREGMCHQWINRLVEYFLAANPEVKCGNTREQKVWDDFQSTFDWRELIKLNFQHKFTYGNAVWQWIYNPGSNKKISLTWLDPKYFDALRDQNGRIKYDKLGKPIGYVQYIKFGQDTSWIPEDRMIQQIAKWPAFQSGQGCAFKPDEVIHFVLNRVGDFWWGIGILEPAYNFVKIKQNADEGYGEMMQRTAMPRIVGYVGDDSHPPTQEAIDDVWEQLSNLESKHQFAGPYYYKLEILEPKNPQRLQLTMNYLINGTVAALGGPKPFITGSGEQTNRATLADQKLWLERSLKMEQSDTSNQIQRSVLTVIAKQEKFKTIPKLQWTEISTESLESKVDRLVKLTQAGLLSSTPELEAYIKKLEDIPEK